MSFIAGQISYKMMHGYDCKDTSRVEVELLKKQVRERDSLLYFWFNDYTFHIRVISGIEKDTSVLKYQIWNHECVGGRKNK